MTLSASAALELASNLTPAWLANRSDVERVDKWFRGENEKPWMPRQSSQEYKDLQARAMNRYLKMVVRSFTEVLYVDGYRSKEDAENARAWSVWQKNGLDARQLAVHEGAMAHAISYVSILPGSDYLGEPMPVIRGHSARSALAWFDDTAGDEWPLFAIIGKPGIDAEGSKVWNLRLFDDEAVYYFTAGDRGDDLRYLDTREHGAGRCPIVRFANELDLDNRAHGMVEPNIPLAARIDQDIFDRLIVQRFASWKVRTIAGMEEPATESERATAKLRLRVEDLLVSESPDTRFGTLDETPIDGFLKAKESDVQELAVNESVPPHNLLGQMANLSAEALAAAESSFTRKLEARKTLFGESWEQVLRMAAFLSGDSDGAANFEAEVRWRDMESRSLAQTADALGKLATMLGVPPSALWERIPGVTQTDLERWKTLQAEADPFASLAAELGAGMAPPSEL